MDRRPDFSRSLVAYGGTEALTRETRSGARRDRHVPAGPPVEALLDGGLS